MDVVEIFSAFGILGLALILLLETGFLPFFFLPGDTLLFTAGYLIHAGDLPIHHALIILSLAAFLGNIIGYYMGAFAEKPLIRFARKEGSTFQKGLERTRNFYDKYGMLTLVFAKFVPSVRTIAPFLAGVLKMKINPFIWISLFSSFFWVGVGLALGSFLGKKIPNLEEVMLLIIIIAVSFAFVPVLYFYLKNRFFKKKK